MTTLRHAHDLIAAGDIAGAKVEIERAGAERPDWFDYLTVRGYWHMKQLQFEPALDCLDNAVPFRPLDPTGHYNRGLCLYELGRFDEAMAAHRMALKVRSGFAKGWMKLGACHLVMQNFADALACYERAVGLGYIEAGPDVMPGSPAAVAVAELHIGLGTAISVFGDDAAAVAEYRRALALNPAAMEAETALGFSLLRLGDWEEGWQRFEGRWRLRPFGTPWDYRGAPLWAGALSELKGKKVLLRSEQGHGDTIQFARYVPLVAKRAERVWLEVAPPLARLVEGLGAEVVVRGGLVPDFDLQTSLMTLPLVFGTRPDYCPPPARYRGAVRRVGSRVGVCWHGGARPQEPISNADDQRRSIPWEMFRAITEVAPCISLQEEDLRDWGCRDWADTAEIVRGLDLVVTVDTAVAHLAGSLGIETWLLARTGGCWRWLGKGERTAWYPTMRLYRQPVLSEWAPVIERVVADLRGWLEKGEGRGWAAVADEEKVTREPV